MASRTVSCYIRYHPTKTIMLPLQIDFIAFVGSYFVAMMLYNAILQSNTHSVVERVGSAFMSYAVLFFVLDFFLNVLLMAYEVILNPSAFLQFIGIMLLTGLLVRVYTNRPEKLNIDEMRNFMKTSLLFGNYFRLKDVDTQEQIGNDKMKKLYQEVHGKPFTDDVIATPFDQQVTTFKKVSIEELRETKKQYPPEYFEEVEQLNAKKTTDVSVSFRFQLLDNTLHALLKHMVHFKINPLIRNLDVHIRFPVEKKIPIQTSAEQNRLVERVYESLQILIAQEWFTLYVPFFSTINVECQQSIFDEAMNESIQPTMSFKVSLLNLQLRSSRITTGSEIVKIADVKFLTKNESNP
ncbi:MAG: hypothetical protein WDA22_11250 [Bacteroidota bacterium]